MKSCYKIHVAYMQYDSVTRYMYCMQYYKVHAVRYHAV